MKVIEQHLGRKHAARTRDLVRKPPLCVDSLEGEKEGDKPKAREQSRQSFSQGLCLWGGAHMLLGEDLQEEGLQKMVYRQGGEAPPKDACKLKLSF